MQALANLKHGYTLYAVDPSRNSLDLALKMYEEVKTNSSPELFQTVDINELPPKLFTVIIATNSKQRYPVTKALLDKEIQNIIFEKILFQNPNEYHDIENHLINKNIQSWVNCWRRIIPFYQKLRESIQNNKLISLEVTGDNWGMASNVIHFIDLLCYLFREQKYFFSEYHIDLIPGKRDKYFEFIGKIKGFFGDESIPISFQSFNNSNELSLFTTLQFDNKSIIIDDVNCTWVEKNNDIEGKIQKWVLPHQSEMTNLIIDDLNINNTCYLPQFSESCKLHLPMIEFFTRIFHKSGIHGCPIT